MSAPHVQPRRYNQEEIQQILQIAITRQTFAGEFDRQQLVEIAKELEIDEICLQAAEEDWAAGLLRAQKRNAFDSYRRHQLKQKVARYTIVNTFLVSIDVYRDHTLDWSPYILLIWGLVLALNAWKTFQSRGEAYEKAFQRWKFRSEMRRSFVNLWQRLQKAWQAS